MEYRTLFISDTHLGIVDAKTDELVSFLKKHHFDKIYIVGDFIDFWAMNRRKKHWTDSTNSVIRKLLKESKHAEIIWVIGNHDEAIAEYSGSQFGHIRIATEEIHVSANGKRYLVIHGHQFDVVMKYAKWLAILGDWAYTTALLVNRHYNGLRKILGLKYWSLSAYLKSKVKNAVQFIGDYEKFIVQTAKIHDVVGVICGHIHHAADQQYEDIRYLNCGDWVESCTAIVEDKDGNFQLIHALS